MTRSPPSPLWSIPMPAGKAWFFKIKIADKGELGGLMDEAAYAKHTA